MKACDLLNGTVPIEWDGCPCGGLCGEWFLVEVHCWRANCGHGCPYSGVHVTGTLDDGTLRKIANHVRWNNPWWNHTDWTMTVNGEKI